MAPQGEAFPPHTRGWTPEQAHDPELVGVSPAHAGMDLCAAPRTCLTARFPRTRGDGPVFRILTRKSDGFPPHTRGWTLQSRGEPVA